MRHPQRTSPLPADGFYPQGGGGPISQGYVLDLIHEEDPEEDSEEEHADYPADGGDGDDEPSGDDTGDDDTDDDEDEPFEDEEDDEEEKEHLAPADSSAIPVVDPVPSAGDTEVFETDESAPTRRTTSDQDPLCSDNVSDRAGRLSDQLPPMSDLWRARIAEHAAHLTPYYCCTSPLPITISPSTTSSLLMLPGHH
ncbi:hypothetical protein Tco_0638504 [Tanacetum coccineum]